MIPAQINNPAWAQPLLSQVPITKPTQTSPISIKGQFKSEKEAVRAIAKAIYQETKKTGLEYGALILEKNGVYTVADVVAGGKPGIDKNGTGLQNVASSPQEIEAYRRQGYKVSHIHSHPDKVVLPAGTPVGNGRVTAVELEGDTPEGPSFLDFIALYRRKLTKGYVVTGDGDVVRYEIPAYPKAVDVQKEGILTLIDDVDPSYDNQRPLNCYHVENGAAEAIIPAGNIRIEK
jgi:hypothetical protein